MSILEIRYTGDPAGLPCVEAAELRLWNGGSRSTAWNYCLDADRADCARHRAEGHCGRGDEDWEALLNKDARGDGE